MASFTGLVQFMACKSHAKRWLPILAQFTALVHHLVGKSLGKPLLLLLAQFTDCWAKALANLGFLQWLSSLIGGQRTWQTLASFTGSVH